MKIFYHNQNKIYFILLLISSLFFNFYYGYRGILPIDSFLIFDAGFNVLNGYHPFKDYWSITGPLLDYLQSSLFFLFDVSWFSYVLHGTLINVLITLFCFYFFKKIGLNYFFSFIYSLGISILAYPNIGTPFVDHHAVIFTLISVCFLSLGILYEKNFYYLLSSVFLVLSFFSKQIPSAYFFILIIFFLFTDFYYLKEKRLSYLTYFFTGLILCVCFVYLFFLFNGISIDDFLIQYLMYPFSLGKDRVFNIGFDFKNIIGQFKFLYLSILPLLFITIFSLKKGIIKKKFFLFAVLNLSATFIFIYSQLTTKNQIFIFFLIPFFSALSHIFLIKFYNKNYLIYLLVGAFIFSTTKYHVRFNHLKKFIELETTDFNKAVNGNMLDESFSGLKWLNSEFNDPKKEMAILIEMKNLIINDSKRKFVITDYQFFNSLTGNLYLSPSKWYDVRSVPRQNSDYFEDYKKFFLKRIKKDKIEIVYIIGSGKKEYITNIIDDKNCIKFQKINKISFKINLTDCKI